LGFNVFAVWLGCGTSVALERTASEVPMLCLTRSALGLALVGVCLLGTRTFAADLVAAVLALLQ
jgi:hypothetical protein